LAWRPLVERTVRPMRVVVVGVYAEDVLELAAAEDQHAIEALTPERADPALGVRPRRGARTGALITRMPSKRKTPSKSRVNLLSRSRIRKRINVELHPVLSFSRGVCTA
jgi:hypothetical protein